MENFDYIFYLNFYPDIRKAGLITKKQAYNHYRKYGKKEGRVCSYNQLIKINKSNMINKIKKINTFKDFKSISENKIHIIIRTHLRKSNFKKVMTSINQQSYSNYIIHVAYDHIDSLKYIKNEFADKMVVHKVKRNSDKNAFFDLYCDDIKNKITDGWIMFLDDDNYLIHENCLKIINEHLKEKIVVWSFLRPDKLITPNLKKLKYGEIDNCSYIFHHSIKKDGQFGDYYGSDFKFINSILVKHSGLLIDFTLISTQYDDKVSNIGAYENKVNKKFIEINRIDFHDYKNHYKDLQHLSIGQLKKHYNQYGKYESRIVKFLDFNYEIFRNTINNYLTYYNSSIKFTLITTLYNEVNEIRLKEYIICLEHHQKNQFIEKIVVFYDNFKGKNDKLLNCFNNLDKVVLTECTGRPYFIDLFNYSNRYYNKKNIIICNADIIFDHTLYKLEHVDMKDKLYALTRWDYIDEFTASPRLQKNKIMGSSKDAWIFQTPFNLNKVKNNDKFSKIQIGTWNCDGALNYFFEDCLIHECLSIKSFHVHFFNGRTEKDTTILY